MAYFKNCLNCCNCQNCRYANCSVYTIQLVVYRVYNLLIFQVVWIVSGILLIFQKTARGRYLYTQVTLLPVAVHVCMMVAGAAIFGWVFLWNKYEYVHLSFCVLVHFAHIHRHIDLYIYLCY